MKNEKQETENGKRKTEDKRRMKGDNIAERLLEFGARVVKVADALPKRVAGRHVGSQLLRCGTSAGANYEEGRNAESRADFVHKVGVARKEASESCYWLRLIQRAKLVKPSRLSELIKEAGELTAILTASIKTAKARS
jgi:four helix bundle protein